MWPFRKKPEPPPYLPMPPTKTMKMAVVQIGNDRLLVTMEDADLLIQGASGFYRTYYGGYLDTFLVYGQFFTRRDKPVWINANQVGTITPTPVPHEVEVCE